MENNKKILRFAISFEGYVTSSDCVVYKDTDEVNLWRRICDIHCYKSNHRTIRGMKKLLKDCNGDGADYIISIINLNTGKIEFKC